MITLIRIKGMIKLNTDISETLYRLRLRRKYSCVVINNPSEEVQGMINKVKQMIAFGEITEQTLIELIEKRGQPIDKTKKINSKEVAKSLLEGKSLEDNNLKPFFRLHPARKGINTKESFPKGVLGNHSSKINELIKRML